jgi:small-conductance mechanosensitive channel/CRP-like cAMP-binding protein
MRSFLGPVALLSGWQQGLLIGLGLLVIGVLALRTLVRRQVPWWPSVATPLLVFGPAVGTIVGAWASGAPLLFGRESGWPTNVAWGVLVFVGATALFGLVRAFLESRIVKEELGFKIPALLLDAARWIFWITMIFVVVGGIWKKTEWFNALFTASAVGTVILGLALQETLANFIAGVALLSERTYALGDWVWLGEEEGEVVGISRRTTRLLTRQGDILVLPNRQVASNRIRNMSLPTTVHAEFVHLPASRDAPPNRVRLVLRQAIREVSAILADPPPRMRLRRHVPEGAEYEVKFWTTDIAGLPDVRSDLMIQIWYHFRRAGIEVPYPVQEWRRGPRVERGSPADGAFDAARARLATVPFFAAMPDDLLAALARGARFLDYGAGEHVVHQGQPGDDCYVVESGSVAVDVSEAGSSRQVAVLDPGDLFGEMSLLTGEPRSASVRALDDARLLRLGAESLREVLAKAPELALRLAEAATLRREGLQHARAALDATVRARVEAEKRRLGEAIRRFFRLHEASPPRR